MRDIEENAMVSYPPLSRGEWQVKISETDYSICVFMINMLSGESEVRFFKEPIEAMYWIEYISEKYKGE